MILSYNDYITGLFENVIKMRALNSNEHGIQPEKWLQYQIKRYEDEDQKLSIPIRNDGKPFSLDSLYPDQLDIALLVIDKIKEWVECKDFDQFNPLYLTISGAGGSGKSVLLQTIVSTLRTIFNSNGVAQVAAPTGSAAFNVNGTTLHSLVSMGIGTSDSPMSQKKKKKLTSRFSDLLCLIIDERSLLSASDLGKAEKCISNVIHNCRGNENQLFGGLPVFILVGDDYQLPAQDGVIQNMEKKYLPPSTARGMQVILECSKKVMHLTTSKRMSDSNTEQKDIIEKIRLGSFDTTEDELDKIQSLSLDTMRKRHGDNVVEKIQEKAVFLYYTNKKKDTKNMEMLHCISNQQDNPVAIIRPTVTGPMAGKSIARHFPRTQPLTSSFICIGARVALNGVNLNPLWGLYNGACGVVQEIVYYKKDANPNNGDIPDYVIVDFPAYTGPVWDQENPTQIPVPTHTYSCNKKCCTRTVTPLILAWAITIHRFQGQSAGPVDPGKIPNPYECIICDAHDISAEQVHLGLFYTAASRATTLGGANGLNSAIYFTGKDFTRERITNIGKKSHGRDYYASFVKRAKWVSILDDNTFVPSWPQSKRRKLVQWAQTTQFDSNHVQNMIIQHN